MTTKDRAGLLRGRFDHWYLDADDPKNDASWIHGWNECLDTVRAALAATEPGLDVEDVRALLAGWGMSAFVTFNHETYKAAEAARERLAARLTPSEKAKP